jgi:hypothetical protein
LPSSSLKGLSSLILFPLFAAGVVDTGGAPLLANISRIFEKIWNGPNGILWGWGETDSWKKPEVKKSRDTVPLNWCPIIPSPARRLSLPGRQQVGSTSNRAKEASTLNVTILAFCHYGIRRDSYTHNNAEKISATIYSYSTVSVAASN